jgi:hypothetical protein
VALLNRREITLRVFAEVKSAQIVILVLLALLALLALVSVWDRIADWH